MSLIDVDGLDVSFGPLHAVRDVSLSLGRGECLALVGESGSGKSVTARSLAGLAGHGASVTARRFDFDGTDLRTLRESGWRSVRGRRIGLVLQDALVSLDPLRRVGAEIAEPLRTHRLLSRAELRPRVLSLLDDVGVPDPARRARQYPHELSGGLRQRALIASAVAAGPDLLIADEPTTALDVTVQAQVLALLRKLRGDGTALLLISHDLSVVAGIADRVAVMYAGRIVEQGPADRVLKAPRHPYTRALLDAVPATHAKGTRLSTALPSGTPAGPEGCAYAARCPWADDDCRTALPERDAEGSVCHHPFTGTPRPGAADTILVPRPAPAPEDPAPTPAPLSGAPSDTAPGPPPAPRSAAPSDRDPGAPLIVAEHLTKRYRAPDGTAYHAVRDVSLTLHPGETLGIVGESGSGKTTVARILLGLTEPDEGTVTFDGFPWSDVPERARRPLRRRVQAVQQDPLGSFDPRYDVERVIGEAVALTGVRRGRRRRARVTALLDQVGLPASVLTRRTRDLSGGQRQRVAIARALAPAPDVLVCDEPVSALDVSVQAQILDLLDDLRAETGVALLFISHDLGVVHHVSDRVLVMRDGQVVESGDVRGIFARPAHPYTRQLLAAVPGGAFAPAEAPAHR
ncbi:dipeptide ABC transporter ATP-binding protein [Streptomyces sp. NPDC090088]|uniref:ABC transporter ATP-binding protein n=1 Tax=Streptomyces sp. NPDC090088 TaxID=3365944 RepID=UPI003830390A